MIDENKLFFRIQLMCRVLSVSTSGYYDWVNRPQSARSQLNAKLKAEAKVHVFDYIDVYYNRKRLHSTLGFLSPVSFEE